MSRSDSLSDAVVPSCGIVSNLGENENSRLGGAPGKPIGNLKEKESWRSWDRFLLGAAEFSPNKEGG